MRVWRFAALALAAVGVFAALALTADDTRAENGSTFIEYGNIPVTDGENLVWTQQSFDDVPPGERRYNLFVQHISTGERVQLVESSSSVREPAVDGGVVVWSMEDAEGLNLSVFGYDMNSDEQFMISGAEHYNARPTVSGNVVVWFQMVHEGNEEYSYSILGRNIQTMDEQFVIRDGENSSRLILDGDRLLWFERDETGGGRLLTMPVSGTEPKLVQEVNLPPNTPFSYGMSGDLVVYKWLGSPITAVNLETGDEVAIPAEPYDSRPVTDGRFVFWSGNDPDDSIRSVLSGYDLKSGSRFDVHGTGSETSPSVAIGGEYVTWTKAAEDPGVREVHLAPISELLPSAGQPQPTDDNPNRIWFPETGHSIVFGFKNFWKNSGGLPVFGFPLTGEFDELNQDTGEYHTVQYFERQRYEYHPEHAGTPYEVLLGRLGHEDAARQGLLDQDAFQPVDEDSVDEERCHYFEATGFTVCNEFLDYWQSHGLDFGDDGVSYRESLALFGYPISQEYFPEPGGAAEPVTVQYFERARFEFHPSNPEEHRVLLGLLGADLLDQRDW